MPRKFKLSKKTIISAAVSAALAGTLAAAIIEIPNIMEYVFDADKYNYSETRESENADYRASAKSDTEEENGSITNDNEDREIDEDSDSAAGESNSDSGIENTSIDEDDIRTEDMDKSRFADSVPEINNMDNAGMADFGYTLVNTAFSTEVASSYDGPFSTMINSSGNIVEINKNEASVDSFGTIPENEQPQEYNQDDTPQENDEPVIQEIVDTQSSNENNNEPENSLAGNVTDTDNTNSPETEEGTRTENNTGNTIGTNSGSGGSVSGGSGGGGHTNRPPQVIPTQEPATQQPEIKETQTPATSAPAPTERPAPTREPLPTEAPEPQDPSSIIKDNEDQGNEVEISKGEIEITDHTGGSGSVSSGGATRIDFTRFSGDQSSVEYIHISSTIKYINFQTAYTLFPNLKGFVVAENNRYYKSIDGVLYSKDGKILYACPAQVDEITEFPKELEEIYDGAFLGSSIEELNLPSTVTQIGDNAFAQASMGTVVFNSDKLTIGSEAFFNSEDSGLSVKTLVFNGKELPQIDEETSLKFKNPNTGLDESGMKIIVPDSENDSVLCSYMKAWGEIIDKIYGSGMTDILFDTQNGAGKNYLYTDNALYRQINTDSGGSAEDADTPEYELIYVYPSRKGEFEPVFNTVKFAAGAFDGCNDITTINIPSTVTTLENGSLDGLKNIVSIIVSSSVPAEIGDKLFEQLDPEEFKIYVYPDSRDEFIDKWGTVIDSLFGDESAEKIINAVSEGYKYIDGALYAVSEQGNVLIDAPHTNMDNFAVDSSAVKIEEGAFSDKYSYGYVYIPASVEEITPNAFANADIEVLVLTATEPSELPEDINLGSVKKMYVPKESLDKYKEIWGGHIADIEAPADNYVFDSQSVYGVDINETFTLYNVPKAFKGAFTMLDNTRELAEKAMYGCDGVEEIQFSVMTESVGKECFSGMTSIKHVDMSRLTLVKELPDKVFYDCTSLNDIQLPVLLENLGASALENCGELESVNFSKLSALKSVGDRAFYNCTSLKSAMLNSSKAFTQAGESVFENCVSLENVRMPLNLEKMSDRMFKNCSSLNKISMSSTMTEIGDEALYGTAIESFNISSLDKVTKIGEGAVAECGELKEIELPAGISKVSARMAENDVSLTNVVLGDNVEEIGDAAFKGCLALEEFVIPEKVSFIGADCFSDCVKLKKITVKAEVPPETGENAFGSELDGLKIYVPENSYDDYVSAWDEVLYKRASEIIVKPDNKDDEEKGDEVLETPAEEVKLDKAETEEDKAEETEVQKNEYIKPSAKPETEKVPEAVPTLKPIDTAEKPTEKPEASSKPAMETKPQPSEAPQQTETPALVQDDNSEKDGESQKNNESQNKDSDVLNSETEKTIEQDQKNDLASEKGSDTENKNQTVKNEPIKESEKSNKESGAVSKNNEASRDTIKTVSEEKDDIERK